MLFNGWQTYVVDSMTKFRPTKKPQMGRLHLDRVGTLLCLRTDWIKEGKCMEEMDKRMQTSEKEEGCRRKRRELASS